MMAPQIANALSCTRDGVALVVEELANEHRELDIFTAVLAVRASRLFRTQSGKLRFPVAKSVRLDADDVRDFADFEEELIRQLGAPCHWSA